MVHRWRFGPAQENPGCCAGAEQVRLRQRIIGTKVVHGRCSAGAGAGHRRRPGGAQTALGCHTGVVQVLHRCCTIMVAEELPRC